MRKTTLSLGKGKGCRYRQAILRDNQELIIKLVDSGEYDFGDKYIKAYKILEDLKKVAYSFSTDQTEGRPMSLHSFRVHIRNLKKEGKIPNKKYLFLQDR